ncbi:MAG TPA: hypothetical protein PKC69_16150, partial [Chitinophagaceae bacterium]|nr:hypothetical protein [Chitinophagaceae bacterium]
LLTLAESNNRQKMALVAGLVIAALYVVILLLKKFKPGSSAPQNWLPVLFPLLALAWLGHTYWWVSLLMLTLFLLDKLASRRLTIHFTDKQIRFPSVPVKFIDWKELNNVVLKDGLLTIDYKNNKLLQAGLAADEAAPDENYFNDFCNRQLNK